MEEWFQAHARHHEGLIFAAAQQGNVLDDLGLYPVNKAELDDWLERHQRMHTQMGQLWSIAGTDLTGLDLKNKNTMDSWFFQHFLQHQAAGQLCGMPI